MANSIATENEIVAALTDADRAGDSIPSLADDTESAIVPIVVPADQPQLVAEAPQQTETDPPADAASTAISSESTENAPSAAVANPAGSPTDGKQLLERFKKAKISTGPTEATQVVVAAKGGAKPQPPAAPAPKVEWLSRLIPAIDAAFACLDRPFFWIPAKARGALGWIAILTLLISFGAGGVLPMLVPRRDVTDFIHERRAAAERPVPIVAGATAAKAEHGDKPEGGHGDKKSKPSGKKAEKSASH